MATKLSMCLTWMKTILLESQLQNTVGTEPVMFHHIIQFYLAVGLFTSAEKQRQFSSPTTPQFEQSSAGYHRLPPANAETLIAGGRRQFHRRSPALTGSTAIPCLVGSSKPLLLVYTVLHKGWISEQIVSVPGVRS